MAGMTMNILAPLQGEHLPLIQWNFEELKTAVSEGLKKYEGLVYTESDISAAKKDRATLNKLEKAIEDKRKEMKALYLAPYNEFEAQVKEVTALIKQQSACIDKQIKEYEEKEKAEKQVEIQNIYNEKIGDLAELVPLEKIQNPKWLNKTVSLNTIAKEIDEHLQGIREGLDAIRSLCLADDESLEVMTEYLKTYDLAAALSLKNKIMEQRAKLAAYEDGKKTADKPAEGEKESTESNTHTEEESPADGRTECHFSRDESVVIVTVDFRVRTTPEKLNQLKAFLLENGIQYGRVE